MQVRVKQVVLGACAGRGATTPGNLGHTPGTRLGDI